MTQNDMLREIREDIKTLISRESSHATEIIQLKKDVEPISGLVAWRERWGGVTVSLGFIGSLGAFVALLKAFL